MMNKIKSAFHQIKAKEELKEKTKEYVFNQINKTSKKKNHLGLITAMTCFFCILFGNWLYFTPIAAISFDLDSSMEVQINRFNRIVSIKGLNADGQALIDSLQIQHMDYKDGVDRILENEAMTSLLSEDEVLTISVITEDEIQSEKILESIQSYTTMNKNMHCYHMDSNQTDEAKKLNLSYGKYNAFLELQALNPEIKVSDIEDLSMKEIFDWIDRLDPNHSQNKKGHRHQHQ